MAFDGFTVKRMANELNRELNGAHIKKIIQPEREELLITFHCNKETKRLLLSANASLPLVYLTKENRTAPATAPNFCMVLRKHIGGGRIAEIVQIKNERVIRITIEHLDELGDPAKKYLYVEIMGKHSNLIFTDDKDHIIDAIKHISALQSSVREVLPGREYFIPYQEGKLDPYMEDETVFCDAIQQNASSLAGLLCARYMGFSKLTAHELLYRAALDGDASTKSISADEAHALFVVFDQFLYDVALEREPCSLVLEENKPKEYAPYRLTIYEDAAIQTFSSVSELLYIYYNSRNKTDHNRQRVGDLRRQLLVLIERTRKKIALQEKQLSDTQKAARYMLYGNLLTTYPYEVHPGEDAVTLIDYNTDAPVKISLDRNLSATENATRYFDKYAKAKRTKAATTEQLALSREQLLHLNTILSNLDLCETEDDIFMIRQELFAFGFSKKNPTAKKKRTPKSRPLHFVTEDGFHIYVGKNNYQNDTLTFKVASGNDWWFHAKKIPGSHVIVRTDGKKLPDKVFETAAAIAGYYSSGRESDKLEIDYVQKKEIKRTPHTPPGFVIYYTNYSMTIRPHIPENITPAE